LKENGGKSTSPMWQQSNNNGGRRRRAADQFPISVSESAMRFNNFRLGFIPAIAVSVTAASGLQWAIPALRHPHRQQLQLQFRQPTTPFGAMHAIATVTSGGGGGQSEDDVISSLSTQINASELEIEKKFCIPNEQAAKRLEQTLTSLGFTISHTEEFVDWYFDLPAPHWHFVLNDCWFRYREKKVKVLNNWGWRGSWQVKRGSKGEGPRGNDDGMTVYEEFQGEEAKRLIRDMVLQHRNSFEGACDSSENDAPIDPSALNSNYDGHEVPYLAGADCLAPFARIDTSRTRLEAANDMEFSNLKVDIDKTNFGHMVGEVEAVIDDCSNDKARVEAAKEQISRLVDMIVSKSELESSVDAIGKLEYYLINNQRDLYDKCIEAGSLVN
jgi:hypothetical protein